MRPVNLIPAEERRGEAAPTRTGPLAYIVVGALVVVLAAVTAVVLLGNQIDEKTSQVAALESTAAETQARAAALSPYVSFQSLRDARVETVSSLATSRFDWERVVRELSRLIPRGVWIRNMTGTVSPAVTLDDAAGVSLRAAVTGPAIELVGCARSQPDIARLIASINDVDGVTRVTAANGVKPTIANDTESEGQGPSDAEGASDAATVCPDTSPAFELVAAFDAVPVPATDPGATAVPPPETQPTEAAGVAEAQTETAEATELVPGG